MKRLRVSGGSDTKQLSACLECGAVVHSEGKHERWHQETGHAAYLLEEIHGVLEQMKRVADDGK